MAGDMDERRERARREARKKKRRKAEPVDGAKRMARGYAERPGANVARALEEREAEREAAERTLRAARATRLERRGKATKEGER